MGNITRNFANLITANGPSGIPDGTVTNADLTGNINFKNIIINGDMSIAQRGTTESGITNGGNTFVIDRFAWAENGGMTSTFTMSQDTDVPSGQGFSKSLKLECTGTDTPVTDERIRIETRFEGQNLQYLKKGTSSAESWTLSFWVKSNKTGTYIVNFKDEDNSRIVSKAYTVSSASTWEKKTITVAPDTTDPFDNDNAHSLTIAWLLSAGSSLQSGSLADVWQDYANANYANGQLNFADTIGNEIYITGVQLEAGTTASDFEFLPYDVNFKRCLRYYWRTDQYLNKTGYYARFGAANGVFLERIPFPVPMRVHPSYTHGNGSNNNQSLRQDSTVQNFTIQSNEGNSTQGLNLTIYNGGGGLSWTEGNAYSCLIYNLQCNSEL